MDQIVIYVDQLIICVRCGKLIVKNKECFDESGYEIDHVIEFSMGGIDDELNLQVL